LFFLRHPSLLFRYPHDRSRGISSSPILWNQPFAIAMLHRKIVACNCYLAAALGTLGMKRTGNRNQTLAPAAAIFAGIAQITGFLVGISNDAG
jgi:hypothetical protein